MSELRLIPLGVGEAFTAVHYTHCLALGLGDDWLLIDCPHPIRKMMWEASQKTGIPLDSSRVLAVALTHLHADHCCGLEDYAYYSHFALNRKARVAAHPEVSARLWNGLLAAGMEWVQTSGRPPVQKTLEDYIDLIALSERHPVAVGPFSIECRRTIHGVPTTAFRIRAGGRCLGVSADTAFDPSLIDWLAPADFIVHEATTPQHTGTHTPYDKLAALPREVRDKIHMIHYPDDFDFSYCVIEPLRQGQCYLI